MHDHSHSHGSVCSCGHVHKHEHNTCTEGIACSCDGGAARPAAQQGAGECNAEKTDTGDADPAHPAAADCCGKDGSSNGCSCHDEGCGCGEEHSKDEIKKDGIRLGISAVFFAMGLFLPEGIAKAAVFIISYIIAGYPVLWQAAKKVFSLKAFDETLLMSVASIGAGALGDFAEAAAVMLLFGVGEVLQSAAVGSSRRSISALLDLKPDIVNRIVDGVVETTAPEDIRIGDRIIIKPFERVPLDGAVTDGESQLDTSALTGESVPVPAGVGSRVLAGSINGDGALTLSVLALYADSAVSKIIKMTEEAARQKSPREKFITRFARIYTPSVVALAALIATVPPFLLGMGYFNEWLYTALTFLVISCPCALVISVPLAFFAGLGAASSKGLLVKGSTGIETLAKTKTVAFDKTGTLTKGEFEVLSVMPFGAEKAEHLVEIGAHAESMSTHPIARSVVAHYGGNIDAARVDDITEIKGHGVTAMVDGKLVFAGSRDFLSENGVSVADDAAQGTATYIAQENVYLGYILLGDTLKADSARAISELNQMGIKTVMLTGDAENAAAAVARKIGVDDYRAAMLPEDKLNYITELKKTADGAVAFVGDGINDAPVIAAADVGISMGGLGSDAAIEASDIVLMTDEPGRIVPGIKTARKTLRIVSQNIFFSLGTKAAIMLIGVFGFSSMWLSIIADVGVALLAVANSLRIMGSRK